MVDFAKLNRRSKLEKLLGMLGSEHDGERANAAAFISKAAVERKLSIVAMIREDLQMPGGFDATRVPAKEPMREGVLNALKPIISHPRLTPWERQFVSDILYRYDGDWDLSRAQRKTAWKIVHKVERWEGREEPTEG